MSHILRRVGIAVGSLVAAWLVVWLVGGAVFGASALGSPLGWIVVLVLGGLVYQDILRRQSRRSSSDIHER